LAFVLALLVKFPLRIDLHELDHDVLFYGTITLFCVVTAAHVYRRSGRHGYRLIAVFLLCSMLSGWQIFDLLVLREGSPSVIYFGNEMGSGNNDYEGGAWYNLRYPNEEIMCNSLIEKYFGNYTIAITTSINRDATWFACGG
jgi:hypothetical protein